MLKILTVFSFAVALLSCNGASAASGEAAAPVTCTTRTVAVPVVPPTSYTILGLTPIVAPVGGELVAELPAVIGTTVTALRARIFDSSATTLTLSMATQTDNVAGIVLGATGTPSAGNGTEQTITTLAPTPITSGVMYAAFVARSSGSGSATVNRIEFDEQTCR